MEQAGAHSSQNDFIGVKKSLNWLDYFMDNKVYNLFLSVLCLTQYATWSFRDTVYEKQCQRKKQQYAIYSLYAPVTNIILRVNELCKIKFVMESYRRSLRKSWLQNTLQISSP
jgi:hypothetical protein